MKTQMLQAREGIVTPQIKAVAEKERRDPEAVRAAVARGVVAIPGSSDPDHIRENISVFDFSLTDEEMERIADFDRGTKFDWY